MKYKNRKVILISSVLLLTVFSGVSLYFSNYIKDNLSAVSVRYEKASVTPENLESAVKNLQNDSTAEVPSITLWNRLEEETVTSTVTGITANTNVIETNGDMSQVAPMTFIAGSYVYQGDDIGCVIDTKTAFKLFGSTKVLNNTLLWKQKKYIVRGVVKAKDAMMLIELSDAEHLYNNIEASYQGKNPQITDNQRQLIEDLLVQNGIQKPSAIIDGSFTTWYLGIFSKLPIWLFGLGVVILLIKYTYSQRKCILICLFWIVATSIITVAIVRVSNFSIHIPSQLIPTKWSDFSFYTDVYKSLRENQIQITNCKLMPKDVLRNNYKFGCILFAVLGAIILVVINHFQYEGKATQSESVNNF